MSKLGGQNRPIVYLISEGLITPDNFLQQSRKLLEIISFAVDSKIDLVQIREKELPAKLIVEITRNAVECARNSETKILVNDRPDIALAGGADGIHLTSKSIPIGIIRQMVTPKFLVGVSTHSISEVLVARESDADFATFGPVFETESKRKFGPPHGLEELRSVCAALQGFPVIALGGIDETNIEQVDDSGASGFAAIRFLNNVESYSKLENYLKVKR